MTKSNSIKVRLNLTLSSTDVAFENLYQNLLQIQTQFKNEPELMALEQRKHLLRMLYVCSNNRCSTKCVEASQITQQRADIKNVPLEPPNDAETASLNSETMSKLTAKQPTSESIALRDKNLCDGVLMGDGSRKYGNLILKKR